MAKSSRPKLNGKISVADFESFYWLKSELATFAVANGISTSGKKLDISTRISAHLRGKKPVTKQVNAPRGRDSERKITRRTKVKGWVCDAETRAFFKEELGSKFHFTVSMNKLGREGSGLTYGDLVEHWLAEKSLRKDPSYKPKLGKSGEYNIYVRAFFDDPKNTGKSLTDAAKNWNRVKKLSGPRRYSKKRGW